MSIAGKMVVVAVLAAAVLAGGCVTVRENLLADGSLSVEIEDSGWYVLGFVPILTGSPDGLVPHWFRDDVSPHMTMLVLDRIVARENAKEVGAIVTREECESVLMIIKRASYHTSAVIPPHRPKSESSCKKVSNP